ncbi:MoaD/ThiS family protein [Moraxella catarrhalis]
MCIKRQTQDELAVAVNHQIANWQTKVSNGDIIAFIPPVAGG